MKVRRNKNLTLHRTFHRKTISETSTIKQKPKVVLAPPIIVVDDREKYQHICNLLCDSIQKDSLIMKIISLKFIQLTMMSMDQSSSCRHKRIASRILMEIRKTGQLH